MKFAAFGLTLLATTSAQYDEWDCNHYGAFPTGSCYSYSSSYTYLFECDGTDALTFYQFTDDSCGTSSASAALEYTYTSDDLIYNSSNGSVSSAGLFKCDQPAPCIAATLRYYYDEDCSGDSYLDSPFVLGECYQSSGFSYTISCEGDELTIESYTSSGVCSGSSSSTTVAYDDAYSDSVTGCYEVWHALPVRVHSGCWSVDCFH